MSFKVRPPNALENVFLKAIRSGQKSVGHWGGRGLAPEFGVAAGLMPYALLDLEHNSSFGIEAVTPVRDAMLTRSNSTLIVRVPELDRAWTQKALDSGAQGIMFPMIETADQAAKAASLCLYPPDGERGMGYMTDEQAYGLYPNYREEANANTAVIVQIETKKALSNAEAIITAPNISAVFFGPADMALSLGYPGQFDHPVVQGSINTVLDLCKKHRVPCGTLTSSDAKAQQRLDEGFDYVFPNYGLNMQKADLEGMAEKYSPYIAHLKI
jgi:4-hydroxy-2-oxoheptanedioate aldolase